MFLFPLFLQSPVVADVCIVTPQEHLFISRGGMHPLPWPHCSDSDLMIPTTHDNIFAFPCPLCVVCMPHNATIFFNILICSNSSAFRLDHFASVRQFYTTSQRIAIFYTEQMYSLSLPFTSLFHIFCVGRIQESLQQGIHEVILYNTMTQARVCCISSLHNAGHF